MGEARHQWQDRGQASAPKRTLDQGDAGTWPASGGGFECGNPRGQADGERTQGGDLFDVLSKGRENPCALGEGRSGGCGMDSAHALNICPNWPAVPLFYGQKMPEYGD